MLRSRPVDYDDVLIHLAMVVAVSASCGFNGFQCGIIVFADKQAGVVDQNDVLCGERVTEYQFQFFLDRSEQFSLCRESAQPAPERAISV